MSQMGALPLPKELINAALGLVMLHGGGDKSPQNIAKVMLSALEGEYGQEVKERITNLVILGMKVTLKGVMTCQPDTPQPSKN